MTAGDTRRNRIPDGIVIRVPRRRGEIDRLLDDLRDVETELLNRGQRSRSTAETLDSGRAASAMRGKAVGFQESRDLILALLARYR